MTYNVHDIHPTIPALPGEAQRIEAIRTRLLLESEEVRLGNDRHPNRAAAHLAKAALSLANSKAGMFAKLATLNETHANLRAGGARRWNMRTIAGLSLQALEDAYPDTNDQLIRDEITARRRAIQYTAPNTPFTVALERAWEQLGRPIDPLIVVSEEKILASNRANAREKLLSTETGVTPFYDPFSDEEEASLDEELLREFKI